MITACYYDKFKCKCGDCRHVCCGGWGITVSDEEYFRLLGLDCPAELRYVLDCALSPVDDPSPERYAMMKPSYTGKCRLINGEGLCSLQIACGEDALPAVCRAYPRSVTDRHKGCSCSCEGVVELLTDGGLISFSNDPGAYINTVIDTAAPLSKCIEKLIPDSLEDGTVCGGYALLGTIIKELSNVSEQFAETALQKYESTGETDFLHGCKTTFEYFPHLHVYLRNFIANRMLLSDYPGGAEAASAAGVAAEYALLLFMISGCRDKTELIDITSALYRFVGHTRFDHNAAAILKNSGHLTKNGLYSIINIFREDK